MHTSHAKNSAMNEDGLRIACLIPSATDICVALGLGDCIVGITHECSLPGTVHVLTDDGLGGHALTQAEIHQRVQQTQKGSTCPVPSAVLQSDSSFAITIENIPSLYPLRKDEFAKAAPTVVITQDLCQVCAPTSADVKQILDCPTTKIVSLTPQSLQDILDSFVTVADACGCRERGVELRDATQKHLEELKRTVMQARTCVNESQPRALLLEWLDPPFDGGHWIVDMMEWACVSPALPKAQAKSSMIAWDAVRVANPDVVWIACCGFNLERNLSDAVHHIRNLENACERALQENSIFATDGDNFFARPGPQILVGVLIMALTAYHSESNVVESILALPFVRKDWCQYYATVPSPETNCRTAEVNDIEDFYTLHQNACREGKMTYEDGTTGYSVFTELAHQKRGYCCGSGCRHCPYNHVNVRPGLKTAKIQQPAVLFDGDTIRPVFPLDARNIRVLFFSGGKDSFLTLRALVREQKQSQKEDPFFVVLLTTFDSETRMIAHQDISIDDVTRQAAHLGIPLVGIPLHRRSSEGYSERVSLGLKLVAERFSEQGRIEALVFGDLHLDHIRSWREKELSKLGDFQLMFPLWRKSYDDLTFDLTRSQVPCTVSASTVDHVKVGQAFDAAFASALEEFNERVVGENKTDFFGEKGEFHTLAEVWKVERDVALGG